MFVRFCLCLCFLLVSWKGEAQSIDPALNAQFVLTSQQALQQLRTLIPERLWIQEFSIRVERKAFKESIDRWLRHRAWEKEMESEYAIADSHRYLLRSTLSGESIRILDWYQEFEFSPFWRTPYALYRLKTIEEEVVK